MQSNYLVKLLTIILLVFGSYAQAQHEEHEGTPVEISLKEKIKESINHHLLDSHDFTFFSDSETGKHYGFSLPVILWDDEDGIQLFSSSKFHHGEEVAENNGNYYTLYHNKVYKTDAKGTITLDEHHHPTQAKPLDFSITKSVLMILITGILMLLAFVGMAKSFKKGPIVTGAGRFLEPIILYIRDDIAIPNIGEKKHRKYMPYLLTIFFFVWFLNLFGLTPLGVNVTGNIAITFALAIMTFIITQVSGNKNYWMHIFDPLGNSMPWYGKIPLYIILIPIEILGVFVKPFALMIRLYANIMAGHIVLMSLVGLIFIFQNWIGSSLSFVLSFAISLIELLVALLQAYIFTMLSALYFGFAVDEHEEAH
ncbi:MAG: ATP synthase F0 subunit A [Flavobacterium sp.]|nr:MAG: ATP synthase F0 subunit A [Flavobacterium sp.]